MQISYTNRNNWRQPDFVITKDLKKYVADELKDNIYDECAEQTRRTAQNTAEAFGRLVEVLTEKYAFSVEDITRIVGTQHSHEKIELIETK